MQVKLLRVLQERRFRRLGGTEEIEADIRDDRGDQPRPVEDGRRGQFREDLFYRINVIPVQLPPLRERGDDIPLLAEHFVARVREQMGKPVTAISGAAMALPRRRYDWPGNIRELENAIERAVALERTPIDPGREPAATRSAACEALAVRRPAASPSVSPAPGSTSNSTCSTSSANISPRRWPRPAASRSRPPICSA